MSIRKYLSTKDLALLQQLTYKLHKWEESAQIGKEFYQKEPVSEAALMNALCFAILGQPTPAVGWLRCAVQSGARNIQAVVDGNLTPLGTLQNFKLGYNLTFKFSY